MFLQWKSSLTTPVGMFQEWGLEQIVRRHRARMDTFYREGKLPEDTENEAPIAIVEAENDNPYLVVEHGEGRKHENIQESRRNRLPNLEVHDYQKLYFQFLGEHDLFARGGMEIMPPEDEVQQHKELAKGLYERWSQSNLPGMYFEFRHGRWIPKEEDTYPKHMEDSKEEEAAAVHAMTYEEAADAVLHGHIAASQKIHKREIRLFICSTFLDTKAERHRLLRDVFPHVRDFCALHGVVYHVSDLGWGQADSAMMETKFAACCEAEMTRSLRETIPTINLLLFLTDKYGGPVLPQYVQRDELEKILSNVEDEDARHLVERWYRLDANTIPPAYRLQRAGSGSTMIAPDKHERRALSARWTTTESYLMRILQDALNNIHDLSEQQLRKWTLSPYDNLVTRICPEESQRVFSIIRDITQKDISYNISDNNTSRGVLQQYFDMHPNRSIPDAQKSAHLQGIRKTLKVNKVKCKKYLVNWSPFGVTENTHAEYVDHVVSVVGKQLIAKIKPVVSNLPKPDGLLEEVASHSRFCLQEAEGFCGRNDIVSKVLQSIRETNGREGHLLIIHGVRGSGKTALISKCSSLIKSMLLGSSKELRPVVVLRFCKLVKQMSKVRLLRSLCQQIHRAYMGDSLHITSFDMTQLVQLFRDLLKNASDQRPLLILLDSIDDVMGDESEEGAQWLPSVVPPHVQLIVSTWTCSDTHRSLTRQANMIIEVPTIDQHEARVIIKQMLSKSNRSLSRKQHDHVMCAAIGKLEETPTMLRLKLLLDGCKEWASYQVVKEFLHTVPALYNAMLEQLELEHGKVLVAHVLSLLLISHGGLGEAELVDILSADEEALDAVLLLNKPPVRRFPQSFLSRLLLQLKNHISESHSCGRNVLVFTCRQMEDAVRHRYLGTTVYMTEKYATLLADYFGGEMQDRYPGRKLASQPLFWRNSNSGDIHFNKAKLCELPVAAFRGPYPSRVQESLCNLTFVAAKCAAGMVPELFLDYKMAGEELPGDERLADYKEFVSTYALDIANDPKNITALALNLADNNTVHIHAKARFDRNEVVVTWLPEENSHKRRYSQQMVTPRIRDLAISLHITSSV